MFARRVIFPSILNSVSRQDLRGEMFGDYLFQSTSWIKRFSIHFMSVYRYFTILLCVKSKGSMHVRLLLCMLSVSLDVGQNLSYQTASVHPAVMGTWWNEKMENCEM